MKKLLNLIREDLPINEFEQAATGNAVDAQNSKGRLPPEGVTLSYKIRWAHAQPRDARSTHSKFEGSIINL